MSTPQDATPQDATPQDAAVEPAVEPVVNAGRTHRRSRRPGCGVVLVGVGILAFVATILSVILTVGIWPGEAKLTAPLFCSDDKPDPFVVVDATSDGTGETAYDFSLYCMGARGEVTNEGFGRPFVVLTLAHAVLVVALVVGLIGLVRLRRRTVGVGVGGVPG